MGGWIVEKTRFAIFAEMGGDFGFKFSIRERSIASPRAAEAFGLTRRASTLGADSAPRSRTSRFFEGA
jgi:hypothetical protein